MTSRHARTHRVACTLFLLGGLSACGGESRDGRTAADSAAMTPTAADSAAAMSTAATMANSALDDTAAVHLISAVDLGEAAAGQMAATKAAHADVKAYGRLMVQEHEADLTTLRRLASSAGIALDTSAATRADGTVPGVDGAQNASGAGSTHGAVIQLQQNMQQTMSKLQVATGAEFDRQYIASQVAGHQQVLDLLKQNEARLQNTQVRAHVTALSATVAKHLDRAQVIQRTLDAAAVKVTTAR